MGNKKSKKEIGKGIEELLVELRQKNGWTRLEVVEKLNVHSITEKDIKKWEIGLEYPNLDMLYKLSELYQISSRELVQAKNNSYEKGMANINMQIIKWISYVLNVSIRIGMVITVLIYVGALVFAFVFFMSQASAWS